MPRAAYPKSARLRLRRDFQPVLRDGRLFAGRECVVRILPNRCGMARLGIATPRKFGKSVQRNRFRRLVREAFRRMQDQLGAVDVFVAPRRTLGEPTLAGILADLAATPTRAHTRGAERGAERGRSRGS